MTNNSSKKIPTVHPLTSLRTKILIYPITPRAKNIVINPRPALIIINNKAMKNNSSNCTTVMKKIRQQKRFNHPHTMM